MTDPSPRLAGYFAALCERHLATLTFQEVRRALQALSAAYVERRDKLDRGEALDGAGKRAAFALFYGPLHFLVVEHVVRELGLGAPLSAIVDLGCGTGVGGAAWALAAAARQVRGVDTNRWALGEARFTYAHFGLECATEVADVAKAKLSGRGAGVIAGYTVNELDGNARLTLLSHLLDAAKEGARVLVVEPIAKRDRPWFGEWEEAFTSRGGRCDEWRFRAALPDKLRLLDKAAGLHHEELTARTLCL